jgi:hypothetical protein
MVVLMKVKKVKEVLMKKVKKTKRSTTTRRDGRTPVNVHLTEDEKVLFKAASLKVGMPLATWIRTTLLRIVKEGVEEGGEGS